MKFMTVLCIFILLLGSCKLTNPNGTNINETMLVVENYTDDTIYLKVEDGSLGPYSEHIILPDQTYSQTWETDDEVFVLNNGQVLLRYHNGDGIEETAIVQLTASFTSYYTISSNNSVLVIRNETSSAAWYSINSGDPGYLDSGEIDGISFGDLNFATQIDLFYTGYHVFSNNIELTIYPFNTQDFEINADAGAIRLDNNSLSDIVEVYIAPEDDVYWGNNVLASILEPEESAYWTVEPGWWDIRVIDEWGAHYDFLNNYISLDNTDIFTFRSGKESLNNLSIALKILGNDPVQKNSRTRIEYKELNNY
jgi:hypothetical protein